MKNNILSNFYIQTPIGTLEAIYKNEKLEELFVINKPNDQTKIRPVNNAFEEKFKNYFYDVLLGNNNTFFDKKSVESILNDHYLKKRDNQTKIWPLLIFNLWFDKWMR